MVNFFYLFDLPQGRSLHFLISSFEPSHCNPPVFFGDSTTLVLLVFPPLQFALHFVQSLHFPHLQLSSTNFIKALISKIMLCQTKYGTIAYHMGVRYTSSPLNLILCIPTLLLSVHLQQSLSF